MIVRGPRRADHFTILGNDALRDDRLSYRARGILAYLLSQKPGFRITSERVAEDGKEGREAVRTAFKELEAAGYLIRARDRDSAGRIRTVGTIYEEPQPGPGNPSVVPPAETHETAGHTDDAKPDPGHLFIEELEEVPNPLLPPATVTAPTFNAFWDVWPRRNGKKLGRPEAEKFWVRMSQPERDAAMIGAVYYSDASVNGMAGGMDAHRWLRRRLWVDWQERAIPDRRPKPHTESTTTRALRMAGVSMGGSGDC